MQIGWSHEVDAPHPYSIPRYPTAQSRMLQRLAVLAIHSRRLLWWSLVAHACSPVVTPRRLTSIMRPYIAFSACLVETWRRGQLRRKIRPQRQQCQVANSRRTPSVPAWLCLKLSPPFNHLSAASRPQPVFGRAYLPKKIKILQEKHSSPSTLSSSATAVKYKPTAHVDLMREKCIVGALAVSCMSVTGCSCWPTTNYIRIPAQDGTDSTDTLRAAASGINGSIFVACACVCSTDTRCPFLRT